MLLKSLWRTRTGASALALLVCTSCISLPWRDEKADEVNVVFRLVDNQPLVDATIGGAAGSFIVGSVPESTLLDQELNVNVRRGRTTVVLGERLSRRTRTEPAQLGTTADGILGRDVWASDTLTLDYTRQLLTVQTQPPSGDDLFTYRFRAGVPRLPIVIDGKPMTAIVDTSSPDTLTLPSTFGRPGDRTRVSVAIAGLRVSSLDAAVTNVEEPIVGNRLLAHFVVAMSFRRGEIRLWRDPRRAAIP